MTIVVPVAIPAALLPLPDPADRASFSVRKLEQLRWANNEYSTYSYSLGLASYSNALDAQTSATNAAASASTANTKAIATAADRVQTGLDVISTAANVAAAAGYGSALSGTSTTSLTIAVGAKSFTATAGRQWIAGQFLVASSNATPANFMHGQVTSYNTGSGALVVNVLDIGGSGTAADWNISLSAPQGTTGLTGPSGDLTRVDVSGTAQTAAAGNDYWLENAGATTVAANAAPVDGERFKVTPANGLKTNAINFGAATVLGPATTMTGVLTLNPANPVTFKYSTTLAKWVLV